RVTVLRDGRRVGTVRTSETDHDELVKMIIGRQLGDMDPPAVRRPNERRASVVGATGHTLTDVSFNVMRGEVVGVTGLAGSGFEELPYLLLGAVPGSSGCLH